MESEIARWHYSNHYFAELRGEEVLEDILALVEGPAARAILTSQLKDEVEHCKIYKRIVDKIGLNGDSAGYSYAYSTFVKSKKTLPEKVFAFQILTEAVSSGYCAWRLNRFSDPLLNNADEIVLKDERRHLKMGHSIIKACDPEAVSIHLNISRVRELQREMNQICFNSSQVDMMNYFKKVSNTENMYLDVKTLNVSIARAIISEVRVFNSTTTGAELDNALDKKGTKNHECYTL